MGTIARTNIRIGLFLLLIGVLGAVSCATENNWATGQGLAPPVGINPPTDNYDSNVNPGDSGVVNDVTDDDGGQVGSTGGLPSCFDPGFELDPGVVSGEGSDVGLACEVTENCREPLLCVEGACSAPGAEGQWCDGIDVICPNDGTECIGGLCVYPSGTCAQNVDCPAGYECDGGTCSPADGDCYTDADCAAESLCDFGSCIPVVQCTITEDLRGRWTAQSVMHLREATSGVVGAILSATEWIRDLLQGRGGIPGVGFLVDGIVEDWIEEYLYPYQTEAIVALGDISDLLDDVHFDHTVNLDAPCREQYRGTLTFDRIEVEFRGRTIEGDPANISQIGEIEDAEFGARLHCDSLAIDEFRVDRLVSGLIRWATDVVVQQASEGAYVHIEDLLTDVIDCAAIGNYVGGTLGATTEVACEVALDEALDLLTDALDDASIGMGLMRIEGEAEVPSDAQLAEGHWSGSLLTGDFTGEFTASKM